jgi:DNA-binding transcriptional MerR regulator
MRTDLSIEELAQSAGLSGERTVRYYIQEGVLPRGRKVGRRLLFDEGHARALRLVQELQGRGHRLRDVAEVFSGYSSTDFVRPEAVEAIRAALPRLPGERGETPGQLYAMVQSREPIRSWDRWLPPKGELDSAIPRMLHLFRRGRLVPFLGTLKGETPYPYRLIIRSPNSASPPQPGFRINVDRLAECFWPLIISSTWDRHLEAALRLRQTDEADVDDARLEVLGRSPIDCRRVVSSLGTPSPAIVWALMGSRLRDDAVSSTVRDRPPLDEAMSGFDELHRVSHGEPHFRRAMAEVVRSRSLLLIGADLGDPHFLRWIGDFVEDRGWSSSEHFAFAPPASELDVEFLRKRYNITVLAYDPVLDRNHAMLPVWLGKLTTRIREDGHREQRWSYRIGIAEVTISGDDLPETLDEGAGECAVVSLGWIGNREGPWISGATRPTVEALVGSRDVEKRVVPGAAVGAYELTAAGQRAPSRVLGVIPWDDEPTRNLRLVGECTAAALEWAANRGYPHVRFTLLGAGRTRHFPAVYSLTAMLQALGARLADHLQEPGGPEAHAAGVLSRVTIHVRSRAVLRELAAGRIDPLEIMTTDAIRFRLEVHDADRWSDGHLVRASSGQPLSAVLREELSSGFDPAAWRIAIEPQPTIEVGEARVAEVWDRTLQELGVLPGSTVVLQRMVG